MQGSPFSGPESLRLRGERRRLVFTICALPITLGILGAVLHDSFTFRSIVLIVIGAMLFVAVSRGRFLGGGIHIGEQQFGAVYDIVVACARMVGTNVPHVFLRDDIFTPVVAIGTDEPYALVLSAQYIELFTPAELAFMVGRELGHIKAGHTRFSSILSANGRESPIVAIAFGAWLRIIEYTADRIGLLCCGSLDVALSAIAVSTFQGVGRQVDVSAFAEQRRELDAEPSLRMGEWLAPSPYITNRVAKLATFVHDPLYAAWRPRFERLRAASGDDRAAAPGLTRYAGPWRRIGAFVLDFVIVTSLLPQSPADVGDASDAKVSSGVAKVGAVKEAVSDPDVPRLVHDATLWMVSHGNAVVQASHAALAFVVLAAYVVVLVAFTGQTLGMMICDLRVVGEARQRVGFGGAFARYACLATTFALVFGIFTAIRRVQPFERWSRTRLLVGNAAVRGR